MAALEPFFATLKTNDRWKLTLGLDDDDVRSEARIRAWKALEAVKGREHHDEAARRFAMRSVKNLMIDISRRAGYRVKIGEKRAGDILCEPSAMIQSMVEVDADVYERGSAATKATPSIEDLYLRAEAQRVCGAAIQVLRRKLGSETVRAWAERVDSGKKHKVPESLTRDVREALGVRAFNLADVTAAVETSMPIPVEKLETADLARIALVHERAVPALDRDALLAVVSELNIDPSTKAVMQFPNCFTKEYDPADSTCTVDCDFRGECATLLGSKDPKSPHFNKDVEAKLVQIQKAKPAAPIAPTTVEPGPVAPKKSTAPKMEAPPVDAVVNAAPVRPKVVQRVAPSAAKASPETKDETVKATEAPKHKLLTAAEKAAQAKPVTAPDVGEAFAKIASYIPAVGDKLKHNDKSLYGGKPVVIERIVKKEAVVRAHDKSMRSVKLENLGVKHKKGFTFIARGELALEHAPADPFDPHGVVQKAVDFAGNHVPEVGDLYLARDPRSKRTIRVEKVTKSAITVWNTSEKNIDKKRVTEISRKAFLSETSKGYTFLKHEGFQAPKAAPPVAPAQAAAKPAAKPEKPAKAAKAAKPAATKAPLDQKPSKLEGYAPLSNRRGVLRDGKMEYATNKKGERYTRLPQGSAAEAARLPMGTMAERVFPGRGEGARHLYQVKKIQDGRTTEAPDGTKRKRDGVWRVIAVWAVDDDLKKGKRCVSVNGVKLEGFEGSLNQIAFRITQNNVWSGAKFFSILPAKLDPSSRAFDPAKFVPNSVYVFGKTLGSNSIGGDA